MLFSAYLMALLPLVAATFDKPDRPVCGTVTKTRYRTTTVVGPNPTTVTRTEGDWCYATVTKTINKGGDREHITVTSTKTAMPTVYITAEPTGTVTISDYVATTTVCSPGAGDDIPDDLTNAERLRRGLPLRSPVKRHWDHKPRPSCTPTITFETQTKTITKNKTVVTSTSCYLTKTKKEYNTKYGTGTKTAYTTTQGEPTTITRPGLADATTTVAATSTVTSDDC